MSFTILVTRDFDQMSHVAAGIVEREIRRGQAEREEYVLGLPTGRTPTGLYKHLVKAFNEGRVDASRIRSFNLDEYVGLPGENAQQRALHPQSYSFFMISQLFGLLAPTFAETSVPWGTLVDQDELVAALAESPEWVERLGTDKGVALRISPAAEGVLATLRDDILTAYEGKIAAAGGIDLQLVGVGGRGHVAFHESGIPFEGSRVMLVRLDDDTVANAVADGHFTTVETSPRYAISMGAELVHEARSVLLLASGTRKMLPIEESIFGPVTPDVPISYGQRYAADGGSLTYVLDEAAATGLLARTGEMEALGHDLRDLRDEPYTRMEDLDFRPAADGHLC
ncbi:MAG: 6-phosphogluconolactonase [Actinomycetota bacterium]